MFPRHNSPQFRKGPKAIHGRNASHIILLAAQKYPGEKRMNSAKTKDNFFDFLVFLGTPSDSMTLIMPNNEEEATLLGATIQDQPWFNLEEISRGEIFGITDALRDMRREKDRGHINTRKWAYACAMIDAMPQPNSLDDIYAQLLFNMKAIKNGTEVTGDDGLKIGYRVWPESPEV